MTTVRPILLAVVAAALLAACGRGAASPLPADQAPAFNDADVSFLHAMIPHHQQAIEMAKLVTGRTQRPEVVKLAATITASQAAEVASMQAWLTRWKRPATAAAGTYHGPLMPGMLAEGQLEWLQTLTGTQFDLGFLTMMRTHHSGAVELAQTELRSGTSAEVKTLARKIIATQQTEIRQMQRWKDTWT
jgi:uncharacterized protein (DUF305 family)